MSNLPDILFRKDYRTLPIFISFLERFSFKGCHGPALSVFNFLFAASVSERRDASRHSLAFRQILLQHQRRKRSAAVQM